jgi:putative FmdB family regulatory protein
MPVYEYEAVDAGCAACRDGFEVLRAMNDPPVEVCPICGGPVRRRLSAAFVLGRPLDPMAPSNLAAKGFSRYEKDKQGLYRKTSGPGPDQIKK